MQYVSTVSGNATKTIWLNLYAMTGGISVGVGFDKGVFFQRKPLFGENRSHQGCLIGHRNSPADLSKCLATGIMRLLVDSCTFY